MTNNDTKRIYIIRAIAVAIMAVGLFYIGYHALRLFKWINQFDQSYHLEMLFGIIQRLPLFAWGWLFLFAGYHSFKLNNLGRKIILGISWLFILPFLFFLVSLFQSVFTSPWEDLSYLMDYSLSHDTLNLSIQMIFSTLCTAFLLQNQTKALFLPETNQLEKSETKVSLTKSFLALIFKTFLGGLLGGIVLLGPFIFKALFDMYLTDGPFEYSAQYLDVPLFTTVVILFGAFNAFRLSGDFILIAVLIGAEFALLKNLRKILFDQYSKETAGKTFRAVFIGLLAITTFCLMVKTQRNFQIRSAYSEFCALIRSQDYSSAYEYMSLEYRNIQSVKQFTKDKVKDYSRYCNEDRPKVEFVTTFGKDAAIFPVDTLFTLIADSHGHVEVLMENINERWYLTGSVIRFEWFLD